MAEVTNDDLSIQIAGLRHYLRKVDGGWLPTTEWVKQQMAPVNKVIEDLKGKLEEVHKEIVKNPVTEYWEAAGFDGIAAGIEKLYEGEGLGTAVAYWLSTGGGALAAIIIGGIGVYLAGKLTGIQRSIQQIGGPTRRILALDEEGNLRLQNRTDVENRERRVANGGTGLADLPPGAAGNLDTLHQALTRINPELLTFNNRAPDFLRQFRKLPKQAVATRVTEGLKALSGALRTLNPTKIGKVASATDRMKSALTGFEPSRIPSGPTLQASADAMGNLARETGTLRSKFQELSRSVRSLDDAIGAATTA
ncbi:hypothetical protein ACIQRS_07510 [Streptomyces termitum]|uniref:Uncharacterized protein n=1 Tax=Streptomyces termitum TaxID=67368 RepID=A0A918SRH3_9ACTN|nr:hypothetical protein [Streptomyces termitum]GHA65819.1 hypothetical protein GCM10010305_04560 [Streptomyces termitum]